MPSVTAASLLSLTPSATEIATVAPIVTSTRTGSATATVAPTTSLTSIPYSSVGVGVIPDRSILKCILKMS